MCVLCVWRGLVSRFHGVGFTCGCWFGLVRCPQHRGPPFPRTALLLDRPKTPAATTTREPKRTTFHEETPEREEKNEFCGGKKESAKFWVPNPSNPHFLGPWGPTLSTHHDNSTHKKNLNNQFQKTQTINSPKPTSLHTAKTLTLAKVGLAKVGRITTAKAGRGQTRSWPNQVAPVEYTHGVVRIRESRVGCQNREGGESFGHPRHKQTKEARPHEGSSATGAGTQKIEH